ncbi:MAG: class I SAM-dependent methyltransferase [Chloroflexota bacterium]
MRVKLVLLALRLLFGRSNPWREARRRRNMMLLDVGCSDGVGSPAAALARRFGHHIVGLDVFLPVLETAAQNRVYDHVVAGDGCHLPFEDDRFDVVVSLEVLEHLPKEQGVWLLHELERVSCWLVMISCPVGTWEQDVREGNPYQLHQYVWGLEEIKAMQFNEVRGVGFRAFSGDTWTALVNSPLRPLLRLLGAIATVVSYRCPRLASNVFAWKEVRSGRPVQT